MTSIILVGIISQVWLRRYHPRWYKKYNYILGGALDGGAQGKLKHFSVICRFVAKLKFILNSDDLPLVVRCFRSVRETETVPCMGW